MKKLLFGLALTSSIIIGILWYFQGLNEVEVRSLSDIMKLMAVGENNRTTASTKMNTNRYAYTTSHSHATCILTLVPDLIYC